jgi:nucleoside-diphosphate-sugar epimerase
MSGAPVVILGGGFIGQALANALHERFPHSPLVVSRRDGRRLASDAAGIDVVAFRLEDPGTWGSVPFRPRATVWTFPAAQGAEAFFDTRLGGAPTCVLSSTSCYLLPDASESEPESGFWEVDETSPLDLRQPRFAEEETLRKRGATILALSGLFGGERHPVSWLKRGLVRNLSGVVNLVHRNDVVRALEAWLADTEASHGERLNMSTQTHAWKTLVESFQRDGRLSPEFGVLAPDVARFTSPPSKRVVATRLFERYPALLAVPFVNVLETPT